jgi:hypothetical protein
MRIGWAGWSVEVGDEWTVSDDPECLTLTLSSDGALQLSSAKKRSSDVTEADLRSFLAGYEEAWGVATRTQCGDFDALLCSYTEGEIHWLRWFARHQRTVLFATYNGTREATLRETEHVFAVLATARPEDASEA